MIRDVRPPGFHELVGDVAGAERSHSESVSRILGAVRSYLGMDVAFVSEFAGGRRIFKHVDARGQAPISVGASDPMEEGYCQRVVDGRLPELIPDTADVPAAMQIRATGNMPVGAHLSVPIRLRDGRIYGTFCCFSFAPDRSLNARDLQVMRAFAELVAAEIDRDLHHLQLQQEKLGRVKTVIEGGQLSIAYQPVVRLAEDTIVGFEALSRISGNPVRSPDIWFSEAAEAGLGVDLELHAICEALPALRQLPDHVHLAINVSPATIVSGKIAWALKDYNPGRVLLEITEHAAVADYDRLRLALHRMRRAGIRIAIDDAGAGYASLRHVLNLRPDVIKLDTSLTSGIESDPAKRALALALIGFARETESRIVAEGIENAAEFDTIKILGAEMGQGYFLGRPAPLASAVAVLGRWGGRGVGSASRCSP